MSKTLAKLYTKCLSERRLPTAWKNAEMVVFVKGGTKKDTKNCRPIMKRLQSTHENINENVTEDSKRKPVIIAS